MKNMWCRGEGDVSRIARMPSRRVGPHWQLSYTSIHGLQTNKRLWCESNGRTTEPAHLSSHHGEMALDASPHSGTSLQAALMGRQT